MNSMLPSPTAGSLCAQGFSPACALSWELLKKTAVHFISMSAYILNASVSVCCLSEQEGRESQGVRKGEKKGRRGLSNEWESIS